MNVLEKTLDKLNAKQREAVDAIYGSVMVVAGPGTGKTELLAARTANILKKTDIKGENILITTFTDAGVVAIKKRLLSFLGTESYRIKVTTLHAFAKDIIDRFPEAFLSYRAFTAIDELGAYTLLETVLEKGEYPLLVPVYSPEFYLKDILSAMKNLRKEGVLPENFIHHIDLLEKTYADELSEIKPTLKKYEQTKQKQETHIEKLRELASIYQAYEKLKKELAYYDFDDMILFVVDALTKNSLLAHELAEQYQFIMVDEFQDLSTAQNELLEAILGASDAPNILTVGDDDQSIYRFQGANLENMFHFSSRFTDTKIIVLEENYRSTADILEIAKTLIETNTSRIVRYIPTISKSLLATRPNDGVCEVVEYLDDASEVSGICDSIREFFEQGIPYGEMAILLRTNRDVREWSEHLERAGIPYESKEQGNLLESAEWKMFSSLISISELEIIPDEACIFVLRSGLFDVPSVDIYRACRELSNYNFTRRIKASLFDFLSDATTRDLLFPHSKEKWEYFITSVLAVRDQEFVRLSDRARGIVEYFGAISFIREKRGISGLSHLLSLINFIAEKETEGAINSLKDVLKMVSRMRFLGIALSGVGVSGTRGEGVRIYTAHQSKGLEFEVVFVPNALDKNWGNRRVTKKLKLPESIMPVSDGTSNTENEEERRLFFVALTRAKRFLSISFPLSDGKNAKISSEFLAECRKPSVLKGSDASKNRENFFASELSCGQAIEKTYTPKRLSESEIQFIEEILSGYRLSASDLTKFIGSPERFLEESIFRFPFSDTPALVFGKSYHKTLEEFYVTWKKEGEIPEKSFLLELFERNLKKQFLSPEILESDLVRGKEGLSGWYDSVCSNETLPIAVEYSFSGKNIMFEDIPLTGKIDRIDEIIPGTLQVIDYKTGRIKSENEMKGLTESSVGEGGYFRQLLMYKLLLSLDPKFRNHEVESLIIDFVEGKSGVYKKVSLSFTEEDEENLKNEIRTAWAQISSMDFWREFEFGTTK